MTDKTAVVAWRQGQKERWITKGHKETLGGDKSLSFMWVSFPRCYIYRILYSNMCSLWSSIILQVERTKMETQNYFMYYLFLKNALVSWVFSAFESQKMAFHYTYWRGCAIPMLSSVYSWFMAERDHCSGLCNGEKKSNSNLGSPLASCLASGNLLNF